MLPSTLTQFLTCCRRCCCCCRRHRPPGEESRKRRRAVSGFQRCPTALTTWMQFLARPPSTATEWAGTRRGPSPCGEDATPANQLRDLPAPPPAPFICRKKFCTDLCSHLFTVHANVQLNTTALNTKVLTYNNNYPIVR